MMARPARSFKPFVSAGGVRPSPFPPAPSSLVGAGGLVFGPKGNLFVSSSLTNQVLEYDGTTGRFIDAFVSAGSGGLNGPAFLTFRTPISVPEPATFSLIGMGLLSAGVVRRHREVRVHRPYLILEARS
jgi:hypothetical protein